MESKYAYQLTKKAEADLDDIVSYMAVSLANPQAASDFVDALIQAIDQVCMFPQSGVVVVNDYLPDVELRKILINNYLMYYLSDADTKTLYILRLLYGRRDIEAILKTLDF